MELSRRRAIVLDVLGFRNLKFSLITMAFHFAFFFLRQPTKCTVADEIGVYAGDGSMGQWSRAAIPKPLLAPQPDRAHF